MLWSKGSSHSFVSVVGVPRLTVPPTALFIKMELEPFSSFRRWHVFETQVAIFSLHELSVCKCESWCDR